MHSPAIDVEQYLGKSRVTQDFVAKAEGPCAIAVISSPSMSLGIREIERGAVNVLETARYGNPRVTRRRPILSAPCWQRWPPCPCQIAGVVRLGVDLGVPEPM